MKSPIVFLLFFFFLGINTGAQTFRNPLQPGYDPSIVKQGSKYYSVQTNGRDIWLWTSDRLSDLGNAKIVWTPTPGNWNEFNVWAPEIYYHPANNKWYIYYAAGATATSGPTYANQRSGVLESVSSNPEDGFIEKSVLQTSNDYTNPAANIWGIDVFVFQLGSQLYAVWSGWENNATEFPQKTYIATMSDPWTINSNRVEISAPTYTWESAPSPLQEGPQVLIKNNTINLVYSASGSWTTNYCLGLLTCNTASDPMVPANWTKKATPIFTSAGNTYGPGHCSFTQSPDGTEDWIFYHAKTTTANGWNDRVISLKKFTWNADNTPELGSPLNINSLTAYPAGEVHTPVAGGNYSNTFDVNGSISTDWQYIGNYYPEVETQAFLIGKRNTITNVWRDEKAVLRNRLWSSLEVSCDINVTGGGTTSRDGGIMFRVQRPGFAWDGYEGYFAAVSEANDRVYIGKATGSAWTELQGVSLAINQNTVYNLKVEAVGSSMKVFVNGTQYLNVTDNSYTAGTVGMRVVRGQVRFDNLQVQPLSASLMVTNTNSSGSGSLAQAVAYANASPGQDTIRFNTPTNMTSGTDTWARIQLTAPLVITDAVVIDATAAGSPLQPGNISTTIGGAIAGTGPDGVAGTGDEATLPSFAAPKIELTSSLSTACNMQINASNVVVRGIAFRRIGNEKQQGEIMVGYAASGTFSNILVEQNTFGVVPTGMVDPGAGNRSTEGVVIGSNIGGTNHNNASVIDGLIVRNNYFGFIQNRFVLLGVFDNNTSTIRNSVVENNIMLNCGLAPAGHQQFSEGLYVGSINQDNVIRNNIIQHVSAGAFRDNGIEVLVQSSASRNLLIENNTVQHINGPGILVVDGLFPGINTNPVNIRQNVISHTTQAGVGISHNRVTLNRNSIYSNGGAGGNLPIDLVPRSASGNNYSASNGGNGVSANDGNLNFAAGNQATDYPLLNVSVQCSALPIIQINGYVGNAPNQAAFAHATIEFYKATDDGNNNGEIILGDGRSVPHAEPRTFLGSCTADANGNFNCAVTIPSYVPLNFGDTLVATATVNGSTSETGSIWVLLQDGGDAPTSYNTDISCTAVDGPIHFNLSPNLRMGALVDNDASIVGSFASHDDINGDDEDGIAAFPAYNGSGTYNIWVQVTNTTGRNSFLVGYLDFNGDGDFADAGERTATVTIPAGFSGNQALAFNFSGPVSSTDTYARFRLSSLQAAAENFTGSAPDGEVEDYLIIRSVLPVRLGNLRVAARPQHHRLSWETFTEENTVEFIVETSSNGIHWSQIGVVKAVGNSRSVQQYAFNYAATHKAATYYRVTLMNALGEKYYFNTVQLNYGSAQAVIEIFPNPSSGSFHVQLPPSSDGYRINIYNPAGQVIAAKRTGPESAALFDSRKWAQGMYVVEVHNIVTGNRYYEKLVVR